MNQQPTYDPIVANQISFDPITLMPVFEPHQPDVKTPSGQPINFFIPPPPPAPKVPVAGSALLPLLIGGGTILLLVLIYFIIRKHQ